MHNSKIITTFVIEIITTTKTNTTMRNLYNNYDINESDWYEAYRLLCKCKDIEPKDEDSAEYYEW